MTSSKTLPPSKMGFGATTTPSKSSSTTTSSKTTKKTNVFMKIMHGLKAFTTVFVPNKA